MIKSVKLKNEIIKNDTDKLTFISGPCLLESEKLVRLVAKKLINYSKKNKRTIFLHYFRRLFSMVF